MQLLQARIRNFRSLRDVTVDFGLHTAFIGGNGAGKSSILKALEKFYASNPKIEPDDFYGRDVSLPVEIELTFGNLTPEQMETFQTRVRDGRLTVTRVFDGSQTSGRFHGVVPSNPEFTPIRAIAQATPRRQAYNALRARPKYEDLPVATNADQVAEGMRTWRRPTRTPSNSRAMTASSSDFRTRGEALASVTRVSSSFRLCGRQPRTRRTASRARLAGYCRSSCEAQS